MPGIVLGLGCNREQDRHSPVSIVRTTETETCFTLLFTPATVHHTARMVSSPVLTD